MTDSKPPKGSVTPGGGLRILLAEEDATQCELLTGRLQELGFSVELTNTGNEALEAIRKSHYDALVTNTGSGSPDGFELCKWIRETPQLKDVHVILTSQDEKADRRAAVVAGANALVSISGSPQAVIDALLEGLSPRQQADDVPEAPAQVAGPGPERSIPAGQQSDRRRTGSDRRRRDRRRNVPEIPEEVIKALSRKHCTLIGFDYDEGLEISFVLEQANVISTVLTEKHALSSCDDLHSCDLVILSLELALDPGVWARPETIRDCNKPLLVIGATHIALQQDMLIEGHGQDFLRRPWQAQELLLRTCRIVSRVDRETHPSKVPTGDRKLSVILADDDPTVTTLLRATLKNYDIECHVANNGGEALRMAETLDPSAFVLDINMPELDGFEVLSILRNDPKTSTVPVILLTSRQREPDLMRGFGLGATDYVAKPFNPMELVFRLKRLL